MAEFKHITVLLNEAVDGLNIKPDGTYVDCTLGGGGHSGLILSKLSENGKLYSFDQDITAINFNKDKFEEENELGKINFIKSNFRNISEELNKRNILGVDGILYDLGVSARDVVNDWSYEQLVRIFFRYGEEKFAKSIARRIEKVRQQTPIETTGQLVDLIKEAIPAKARRKGGHPAKKTFQAIRIAVNDELGALEESLEQALDLLNPGGRISVITFQSLEDRLVKVMFKQKTSLPELPPGLPVIPDSQKVEYKLITRKPIVPSEDEITHNNRAHSAKLRIIEKL